MTISTNVPVPTFSATGFVAPAESDILAGVQADQQVAFGGDLNPALETPQGQLASSTAAIIGACNDLYLYYTNAVDPAYADGRMQDAIARIYFLTRNPAEPTTVTAICSGATGTVIPAGSLAVAQDGNLYSCTTGGTIPTSGSISLPFACTTTGPIVLAAGALNTIYRTIPGWDSITNPASGVIGVNVESRAAFEARRSASVALNAVNTIDSIRANVLDVAGVIDAFVTDNATNAAVTVQGVSIAANSLYVAVSGGDLDAVANAIWRKKPPGTPMTGTTTRTVYDMNVGYQAPYPSYAITYTVATSVPIYFNVQIANSSAVPNDALAQIQTAIAARFSGADGSARERIAGKVFAGRYYPPILSLGAWAEIISVQVGTSSPANLNDVVMNLNQIPTYDPNNVSVTLV